MIALPLSYLSDEMQEIAKTTVTNNSMYIDSAKCIGLIAGGDDAFWVYIWVVCSDVDDPEACNREFQDKLEAYIETVKNL